MYTHGAAWICIMMPTVDVAPIVRLRIAAFLSPHQVIIDDHTCLAIEHNIFKPDISMDEPQLMQTSKGFECTRILRK